MPQTPGTRLGAYELVTLIGSGGMGEVYRARDPRLDRFVAIKVLPSEVSADAERLRRFEQEARATAALNHPNILAIHDIGQSDGVTFIVSELLDGQTLRARLEEAGQGLPVAKAVDYAIQIADALAAAHDKGLVHRDVKPENVFVTRDGRVKVLDFGLARLYVSSAAGDGGTALATRHADTAPGTVLGTVGYMSPEQVRGQAVDHRSDIFSFGVVLYEMLAGKKAFTGDSAVETLNAILKEEPSSLSTSGRAIPPLLDRVIRRCLEKTPELRFQSARDLQAALQWVKDSDSSVLTAVESRPAARRGNRVAWLVAAAATIACIALAIPYFLPNPATEPPAVVRMTIAPPPGMSFRGGQGTALAVSPDGRKVAFRVVDENNRVSLAVRWLERSETRLIPGTENGNGTFWSPDSRHIAFFADGRLKRVDLSGGPAQVICDTTFPAFGPTGTWGDDGTILWPGADGLLRVAAAGGTPVLLMKPDAGESALGSPVFLPGGRRFTFLANPSHKAYIASLDAPQSRTTLFDADSKVLYTEPGWLVFTREFTMMARRFDRETLELGAETSVIAENVNGNTVVGNAAVSTSQAGVVAYRSLEPTVPVLEWVDRGGKATPTGFQGDYRGLALAPDARRAAVHIHSDPDGGDVHLLDLDRQSSARFTLDEKRHFSAPCWSVDGQQIYYASIPGGVFELFRKPAAGGVEVSLAKWETPGQGALTDCSDASQIVIGRVTLATKRDLVLLGPTGQSTPLVAGPFEEDSGVVSPDRRWLAYQSDESGFMQVYVQAFPPSGAKWGVSTSGGTQPQWRADGKELFFVAENRELMSVAVSVVKGELHLGVPTALFQSRIFRAGTGARQYAVTDNGQRFLITRSPAETGPDVIQVILNWPTEALGTRP